MENKTDDKGVLEKASPAVGIVLAEAKNVPWQYSGIDVYRESDCGRRSIAACASPLAAASITVAVNAYEQSAATIASLSEALIFYMTICGNTAYSVTRESAREAYERGTAALAQARKGAGK